MTDRPAFARWLDDTNDVTQVFLSVGGRADLVNLAGGLPDPSLFPVDRLAPLAEAAVREAPEAALAYGPIEGLPGLRDLIAARFSHEALPLSRENVLILSGGMQGLDLLGKALLNEGDLIAAQSPAYMGALDAWKPRRPRFRPLRLEAEEIGPAALAGAQFAYTVPNFSNPSGRLVPLAQRKALVAAAEESGVWLVEDDPYGALHYDHEPLPRLMDLARGGPVIYLGTLSKELAPGLRVGWIVAAPEVIQALATAKQGSDMCSSGLAQEVARRALAEGLDDEIRPRMLSLYAGRRDALCAAMDAHLAEHFTWERPVGGMFVWARARDPRVDTDRLMRVALDHGVCIAPSSIFDPEGTDRGAVRLNFTRNAPERLEEGARRLAAAVTSL